MWWFSLVLACNGPGPIDSDSEGDADTDADADSDTDADTNTDADADCEAWGFGEPVDLALPNPLGAAVDDQLDALEGSTTTLRWSAAHDLTGDGLLDLVVTDVDDAYDDASGDPGHTAWAVYPGIAGGFGPAARWALPAAEPEGLLVRLEGSGSCAADGDARRWSAGDVDGDGYLDLLITERCGEDEVGTARWDVHRGAPGGFAEAATAWALPDYGTLALVRAEQPDATGHPASWLEDLDGDGRQDLVIAADASDSALGRSRWDVHLGGASGFGAATAWSFAIAPPCDVVLDGRDNAFDCSGDGAADFTYAVRDLDGDGRPDLVVTAGGGLAGWAVHHNTGSGFAAATPWALPPGLRAADLVVAYATPSTWTGCYAYGLYDLTGDGRDDLVVADDCEDQEVGVTHWNVYPAGAAGFAAEAVPYALPGGYPADAFDHPEKPTLDCASSSEDWRIGVYDRDGSGLSALTLFEGCDDAAVGTSIWRVHPPTCLDPDR